MRILHVWDQAGVAGCMAKYQRRLGHTADVVKIDGLDGLLIDDYYQTQKILKTQPKNRSPPVPAVNASQSCQVTEPPKGLVYKIKVIGYKPFYAMRMLRFANAIRKKAKGYDIVHVHSALLCACFLPFKPKIMEFHGDDIRTYPSMYWKAKIKFRQAAARLLSTRTRVYASTPDIIQEHQWMDGLIDNPVDIELFVRKKPYNPKTALFFENWYENPTEAKQICNELGLELTIQDRNNTQKRVCYRDAPAYYEQFEYFIDRSNIHSLSKTALECLALGTKVVAGNYMPASDGAKHQVLTSLSQTHLPDRVAKRTIQIYEEVLSKKPRKS